MGISCTKKISLRCPKCSKKAKAEIYEILDAGEYPAVYERLLNSDFNKIQCSAGHVVQVVAPVLVHVAKCKKLVFFAPCDLSEKEQDAEADRLMAAFRRSVRNWSGYMGDLAILSPEEPGGYGTLIAFLQRFESEQQTLRKQDSSQNIPREERQLTSLMLAAMKESDPEVALDLWMRLYEETEGTGFRILHAMSCAGIGTCVLKQVLNDVPEGPREKLMDIAASALQEAIQQFESSTEPEQWAAARLNYATVLQLRETNPWKGFTEAADASLPVLIQLPRRAALDERVAALQMLRERYHTWIDRSKASELSPERRGKLHSIASLVIYSLDEEEEQNELINWLQMDGLVCSLSDTDAPEMAEAAIAAYQRILEFVSKETHPEIWAKAHQNLAAALQRSKHLHTTQNLRRAMMSLEACLQVYTEDTYPQKYNENSRNLGCAALLLGKHLAKVSGTNRSAALLEAESALICAYTHFEEHGSMLEFALAANELGALYRLMEGDFLENNERALHVFLAAVSKIKKDEFPEVWASLQANVGISLADRIHTEVGQFEYVVLKPSSPGLVELSGGTGFLRSNNLFEAAKSLSNALTVYQKETHPLEWARTTAYLATVWLEASEDATDSDNPETVMESQENAISALESLEELEDVTDSDNPETVMESQENAISALESSVAIFRMHGAHDSLGEALSFLAGAYSELRSGDRRTNLFTSLRVYRELLESEPKPSLRTQLNFGTTLYHLVESGENQLIPELVDLCRVISGRSENDLGSLRSAQRMWAAVCELIGDYREALEHYERAIGAGERLLRNCLTLESKNLVHYENVGLYQGAIKCCLVLQGSGPLQQAFLMADRWKSAMVAEQMRTLPATPPPSLAPELVERERQLLTEFRAGFAGLIEAVNTVDRTNQVTVFARKLGDLETCWREMDSDPSAAIYLRMRRAQGLEWPEVQSWIGAQTPPVALARFVCLRDRLAVIVVCGSGEPVASEWPWDAVDLKRAKQDVQRFIGLDAKEPIPVDGLPNGLAPLLEWVYSNIGAASELFLLPDDQLCGLPLHAVRVNGRPLFAHVPVAYGDSLWATVRREMARCDSGMVRHDPRLHGDRVLVAGDLTEDLESAADEARFIAELLGTEPLLGRNVRKETLLEALRFKDLVHITGHAEFHEIAAMNGGLRLYGGDCLSSADILKETLNCRFVVLNACHTGRQRSTSSGALLGLPSACLAAGVGRVLATLWPIEDNTARDLMAGFYRRLLEKGLFQDVHAAAALRAALLELEGAGLPPYLWAPFVVYGLPHPK